MAKKSKKKKRVELSDQGFESGSAALFESLSLPDERSESAPAPLPSPSAQSQRATRPLLAPLGPQRALKLQVSSKGRGGKTVTSLKTLSSSSSEERARLAQAIAKGLGCRAWLEEEWLCLQGDQRERLRAWVAAQP